MVRLELPRRPRHPPRRVVRASRQVRLAKRRQMLRSGWVSLAEGGFLITLARPQAQSFRKTFEQPQLPSIAAALPDVIVAPRPERWRSNGVANELSDAQRQRIAVIGRGREGGDATGRRGLDEGIVVQDVEYPSAPCVPDIALADGSESRKHPLGLG